MITKDDIKSSYVKYVENVLSLNSLNQELSEFRRFVSEGELRRAYLLMEKLDLKEKSSEEYRKVDEDFYWTFIQ